MNNSKIWLVVKPTVGVPLFLSAVALGSFSVHVAIVSNTSWVGDFLSGASLGGSDEAALETETRVLPANANVTADTPMYLDANFEDGVSVILPDGRTARLVIDDQVTLASAQTLLPTNPDLE